MFDEKNLAAKLSTEKAKEEFHLLYGGGEDVAQEEAARYTALLYDYVRYFGKNGAEPAFFSSPGRTEIIGNHTDHNSGLVLAAAVTLDTLAAAAPTDDGIITLYSAGYAKPFIVDTRDLDKKDEEKNTTFALIRGVCRKLKNMGYTIGGFNAAVTSRVLGGSGLSSSAAFENLISTSIDSYYNENRAGAVEIAKIGQFAENVYFGKNSGLMDQLVSSVGGFVFIDFADVDDPAIEKVDFDLESAGCKLIITDTKGSHCDLTADYDAVRSEMEAVAEYFGKSFLRETDEAQFWEKMPDIRRKTSDRAVMRAAHFFADSRRAGAEKQALAEGDFGRFLALVNESGDSSMDLLQNLYSVRKPTNQEIPLAIMAGKRILGGRGAIRVHGGGFAGTIQAFVPDDLADAYQAEMDRIFGENSCYIMTVRPVGGIEIA